MSAAYKGPCVADWGERSIRIYTAEDRPRLVATIRAVDSGDVDQLLRAYGWKRVGAWTRSDDTPGGHKVVTVERIDSTDPATDQLERDQADGRARRAALRLSERTPDASHPVPCSTPGWRRQGC